MEEGNKSGGKIQSYFNEWRLQFIVRKFFSPYKWTFFHSFIFVLQPQPNHTFYHTFVDQFLWHTWITFFIIAQFLLKKRVKNRIKKEIVEVWIWIPIKVGVRWNKKGERRNLRHTESFGDEGWESNADIYWKFDERVWAVWEREKNDDEE